MRASAEGKRGGGRSGKRREANATHAVCRDTQSDVRHGWRLDDWLSVPLSQQVVGTLRATAASVLTVARTWAPTAVASRLPDPTSIVPEERIRTNGTSAPVEGVLITLAHEDFEVTDAEGRSLAPVSFALFAEKRGSIAAKTPGTTNSKGDSPPPVGLNCMRLFSATLLSPFHTAGHLPPPPFLPLPPQPAPMLLYTTNAAESPLYVSPFPLPAVHNATTTPLPGDVSPDTLAAPLAFYVDRAREVLPDESLARLPWSVLAAALAAARARAQRPLATPAHAIGVTSPAGVARLRAQECAEAAEGAEAALALNHAERDLAPPCLRVSPLACTSMCPCLYRGPFWSARTHDTQDLAAHGRRCGIAKIGGSIPVRSRSQLLPMPPS